MIRFELFKNPPKSRKFNTIYLQLRHVTRLLIGFVVGWLRYCLATCRYISKALFLWINSSFTLFISGDSFWANTLKRRLIHQRLSHLTKKYLVYRSANLHHIPRRLDAMIPQFNVLLSIWETKFHSHAR